MKKILLACLLLSVCFPAFAYIGPGMGAGLIGTVLGVLGAIFLMIIGMLYYPVKRMFKKYRQARSSKNQYHE